MNYGVGRPFTGATPQDTFHRERAAPRSPQTLRLPACSALMLNDAPLTQTLALGSPQLQQLTKHFVLMLAQPRRRAAIAHGGCRKLQRTADQWRLRNGMCHKDLHLTVDHLRIVEHPVDRVDGAARQSNLAEAVDPVPRGMTTCDVSTRLRSSTVIPSSEPIAPADMVSKLTSCLSLLVWAPPRQYKGIERRVKL